MAVKLIEPCRACKRAQTPSPAPWPAPPGRASASWCACGMWSCPHACLPWPAPTPAAARFVRLPHSHRPVCNAGNAPTRASLARQLPCAPAAAAPLPRNPRAVPPVWYRLENTALPQEILLSHASHVLLLLPAGLNTQTGGAASRRGRRGKSLASERSRCQRRRPVLAQQLQRRRPPQLFPRRQPHLDACPASSA